MIRKSMLVALGVAFLPSGIPSGAAEAPPNPILDVKNLESGEVTLIGKLGRPVGLVTAVEVIIERAPPKIVGKPAEYLLRVISIEGTKLQTPVSLSFSVYPGVEHNLPNNEWELKERAKSLIPLEVLRNTRPYDDQPPRYMSDADAGRFVQNYVGSKHQLLVVETVYIHGVPKNLPPRTPKAALPRFGVYPSLWVLQEVF